MNTVPAGIQTPIYYTEDVFTVPLCLMDVNTKLSVDEFDQSRWMPIDQDMEISGIVATKGDKFLGALKGSPYLDQVNLAGWFLMELVDTSVTVNWPSTDAYISVTFVIDDQPITSGKIPLKIIHGSAPL